MNEEDEIYGHNGCIPNDEIDQPKQWLNAQTSKKTLDKHEYLDKSCECDDDPEKECHLCNLSYVINDLPQVSKRNEDKPRSASKVSKRNEDKPRSASIQQLHETNRRLRKVIKTLTFKHNEELNKLRETIEEKRQTIDAGIPARDSELRDELACLLNKHSMENGSDTPDFILSEFLLGCLRAYDHGVMARDSWERKRTRTKTRWRRIPGL